MVDTQRFRLGPDCVRFVGEVAAILARRHPDNLVHVLQVATYVPLDVDSVARILESYEEGDDVTRVQRDSISFFQFSDPDRHSLRQLDLDKAEHLSEANLAEMPGLMRSLNALKTEDDWSRKVREQHELLRIISGAKHPTVELSYLTSRTDTPSARIQSVLNDFGAQGHIELHYDEDTDTLSYTFPPIDYPKDRFERNMALQESAEPIESTSPMWLIIVLATLALLAIVVLIKLSF